MATEERRARGAAKDERGPQQNAKTRKNLHRRIHALSEENLQSLVHYLNELESGEAHEPNEETVAAMQDVLEGRNLSRTYDNVDEMMKDLLGSNA